MVCSVLYAGAQAHTPGTLSFQVGYDATLHGTATETKFLGIVIANDTSAAFTNMLNITAQYSFASWFSAGLAFDYGSYVEDTADAAANGNRARILSFDARLYPVNKDKFNWYVGGQGGFTSLVINREEVGPVDAQYKYDSPHLGLFTGFNWYMFDVAGIFFQLNYSSHRFELNEMSWDGVQQDLSNTEQTLETKGIGFRVGLNVKFN